METVDLTALYRQLPSVDELVRAHPSSTACMAREIAKAENTTIIVVTHDLTIAGKTDKTFHLNDGKLLDK